MKISVVIPALNEEKYIGQCLESLNAQHTKPHEIIVVDNNSSDKTSEIAKEYRATVISEPRQGRVFAQYAGFEAATGDIIARTDADTIVPPSWIQQIESIFEKESELDAITGVFLFFDLPLKTPLTSKFYHRLMKYGLGGNETLLGANMAIRKSTWNKVKKNLEINEEYIHEDVALGNVINKRKGKIKKFDSLIVYTSGRRIKENPISYVTEYPAKLINTLRQHIL